eukprot:scaffold107171_cov99-Phaeocystis_antarctica.AAC.2
MEIHGHGHGVRSRSTLYKKNNIRYLQSWRAPINEKRFVRPTETRTAAFTTNSPSIRTSSDSAAWNGGAEGGQVLGHPSRMTLE